MIMEMSVRVMKVTFFELAKISIQMDTWVIVRYIVSVKEYILDFFLSNFEFIEVRHLMVQIRRIQFSALFNSAQINLYTVK